MQRQALMQVQMMGGIAFFAVAFSCGGSSAALAQQKIFIPSVTPATMAERTPTPQGVAFPPRILLRPDPPPFLERASIRKIGNLNGRLFGRGCDPPEGTSGVPPSAPVRGRTSP
jgi:hypothetical protein